MRALTEPELAALEAYRDDKLPPGERAALEQALRNDPAYRQAAYEWLGLAAATQTLREQQFAATLNAWQTRQAPAVPLPRWQKRPVWQWVLLVAALGAVLVVARKYFAPQPAARQYDKIAADFFRPERVPGFTMGTPDQQGISPGRRAYAFKRYEEAVPLLRDEFAQRTDTSLLLYLGCAYLATDRSGEAVAVFEPLAQSPEFGDRARWYLALGYMKAGQLTLAQSVLLTIENDSQSAFKDDATGLLHALEHSK